MSNHYLSKVMRKLVFAGICDSMKGHRGGFALTRPADEISFLEVIRATDFRTMPERCAFGLSVCDPDSPCPLHDAWTELNTAFIAWAESTTMGDARALALRPGSAIHDMVVSEGCSAD
ncbi:MAG: Rrf2 family protein [Bradymonadia bacterium]|jgi:Rrf2 family protein